MKVQTLFAFLMFLPLLARAESVPADPFVDRGACPFECCTFRNWTVRKNTKLMDQPKGGRIVGTVKTGEVVQGITGIAYVHPQKLEVVFRHGDFKVGDTFYVLTPSGEGNAKIWRNGKVLEGTGLESTGAGCRESPSSNCWAENIDPIKKTIWWVQIKAKHGKLGWTPEADHFHGVDACD